MNQKLNWLLLILIIAVFAFMIFCDYSYSEDPQEFESLPVQTWQMVCEEGHIILILYIDGVEYSRGDWVMPDDMGIMEKLPCGPGIETRL